MPQLKVQNFYSTTITSDINSTGDTSFTVAVPPTYTSGFLVISPSNSALREIVYFHNVVGNTISVRAENRGQGGTVARLHTSTETAAINDVAEIFNMFSDSLSQCFFVEKTGGITVKVWGGTVFYNGNPVTVADTSLTLADNQTNYIKYSYPTNAISVDAVNSGNIKARVTTVAGAITSIQYYVAKESYIDFTVTITGALPSQTGNAGKVLATDGTNISWQPLAIPNASTSVAGQVEIATDSEFILGTSTGGSGAVLVPTPNQILGLYYFGDGSDGDVTISSNTSLTRDMYYNNLTVNTGVILNPAGFAIYVRNTLTLTGTAKIARDGNSASGQTAGSALATGTCGACLGGVTGGSVPGGNAPGVAVNPSYTNITSASGGTGGLGFSAGGTGASATGTQGTLYNKVNSLFSVLAILSSPGRALALPTTVYGGSPSSGGGGGGGSGNGGTFAPGVGGGSGGNGGNIFIYANILSGAGTISAIGGAGGNGAPSTGSGGVQAAGGGGGGGGGNGGFISIVYRTGSITTAVTGGAGGTGGAGPGNPGANGNVGTTGQVVTIPV